MSLASAMETALAARESKYIVAAGLLGTEFSMRMAELDEPDTAYRDRSTLSDWCAAHGLRADWIDVATRDLLLLPSRTECPRTKRRLEGAERDGMNIWLPTRWEAVERELERRAARCVQHEDCLLHPDLGRQCFRSDPGRWPGTPDLDFAILVDREFVILPPRRRP